jgi:gluconokinase
VTSRFVVMGVAGSGKTAVGTLLAERLGLVFADGDAFHPPANLAKMAAGIPLDDADRGPWLDAIAAWLATHDHAVVACSALRRSYRDRLRGSDVRFIYLRGARDLLVERLANRRDHFFPPQLLDTQLATLEEPGADEHAAIYSIELSPRDIVDAIVETTR